MRRSISTLLFSMAAGLFVGFVLGLLLAPQSGAITRCKLAGKAQETADATKALAEGIGQVAGAFGGQANHFWESDEKASWCRVNETLKGVPGYTQAQVP